MQTKVGAGRRFAAADEAGLSRQKAHVLLVPLRFSFGQRENALGAPNVLWAIWKLISGKPPARIRAFKATKVCLQICIKVTHTCSMELRFQSLAFLL